MKCLRGRVVLKRNFHLKGSGVFEQNLQSLLEQPIYRSIFLLIRVISVGKC